MKHEQIERLIREANPVPNVAVIEPVDVSLLLLDQQRRMDMASNDRSGMEPGPEKRRNGTLIGVALAAVVLIAGLLAIGLMNQDPVAAPQTTVVTSTEPTATSTTAVTSTTALAGPTEMEMHPAGSGPVTNLILNVPDGWTNSEWVVSRGRVNPPGGAGIFYFYVENVYGDRCNSVGALLDPVPGPTVDDLAAAFSEAWGPHATAPVDATLGGYSGKHMVLTVPTISDECPSVNMNGTTEPGGAQGRFYQGPGQIEEIWILDIDGVRQVVMASYFPETSAAHRAEQQAMLDSIRIEPDSAP